VLVVCVAVVCVAALLAFQPFGSAPHAPRSAPRSVPHAPGTSETTTSAEGTPNPPPSGPSWAPAGSGLEPAIPPSAIPDQTLNHLLSSQLGPGWVGGDSTYSTRLPDGQVAFVFSDTLIGTAQPSGTASITGMAHSSELVGILPHLVPDYGGTYSAPSSLIPDTSDSSAEWGTLSTYTQGTNQMIFVDEFKGTPGEFTMFYTGRSGIAVMKVWPHGLPQPSSVVLLPPDPNTEWGDAVLQDGAYLYVYGADLDPSGRSVYGMKIARVPGGNSLDVNAWEYWNGSGWVAGESNAVVVPTVNQLTGVAPDPDGKGFVAVSVPDGVWSDKSVELSYSGAPQGPWSTPQPIYTIPQLSQYPGEIAYVPTLHPELSSGNVLVVSYNIDTTDGWPVLLHDVHSYQPQFLLVSG
jgi:Domain of unknown function (DUF4185)